MTFGQAVMKTMAQGGGVVKDDEGTAIRIDGAGHSASVTYAGTLYGDDWTVSSLPVETFDHHEALRRLIRGRA